MKKKVLTIMITAVITAAMVCTAIPAFALEGPADPAAAVEDFPTVQAFTDEAVAEADLMKIINAGINAPSAINQQPWHFSVVTDPAMFDEINGGDSSGDSAGGEGESAEDAAPAGESEGGESAGGESEGGESEGGESEGGGAAAGAKASVGDTPVAIIISCAAEATGTQPAFDAGLACMNMAIEAGLLGYGTKIVTSPTMTLNGARQDEFRQMLGIPADMTVVGVLLIGVPAQDEADIASSASARNDFDAVVTMITGSAAPAAEEAPVEDVISEATAEEEAPAEAPAEGESAEGESPEGESAEGEAPAEGESESAEGESPEGESPEGESPEGEAPVQG